MSDQPAVTSANRAYNESELVGLIADIYKVLIRLGRFEEDEVVWPEFDGHTFDLYLLKHSERIDSRVISLIQQLPYSVADGDCLLPSQVPVS